MGMTQYMSVTNSLAQMMELVRGLHAREDMPGLSRPRFHCPFD